MARRYTRGTPEERFWSHVEKTDGCWHWLAYRDRRDYGRFMVAAGKPMLAHRFSYLLAYGELPDDLHVCHHCDTPSCVRPDHLFLGTDADNLRDMARKGRAANQNTYKTHCKRGHPLAGENMVRDHRGRRACRTCRAAADKERKRRLRNAA